MVSKKVHISKDLFLDVHHAVSIWRWTVHNWIRQFLRNYAPFDVARRLHFDMVYIVGNTIDRYRWTETTDMGYFNVKQLASEPKGALSQLWGGASLGLPAHVT